MKNIGVSDNLKREYKFYGWQNADVKPADKEYELISNPRVLYDVLSEIWCKETCAPRMQADWSKENMTLGQCSITAFLAQDIFGGKVYGIPREGGNFHCYNVVDGCVFDLTSEQFGDEVLSYEDNPEQFREVHFEKEEKHERYKYLKEQLQKKLGKMALFVLVDAAAKGNIEAAEKVALGYYSGEFGEKNLAKAKKWASYASKHGSAAAKELLAKLG